jgi:hypothetical protein
VLPSSHKSLSKDYPDHEDANLILRCYELRQEPVLRESRHTIVGRFQPRSFEELMETTKPDSPLNAPFRQVHTYWEMVYNFVRNGVVHAEFFVESNNGEGLYLFAKVHPFLDEYRKAVAPRAFFNAEWVATNTEIGQALFGRYQARVQKLLGNG